MTHSLWSVVSVVCPRKVCVYDSLNDWLSFLSSLKSSIPKLSLPTLNNVVQIVLMIWQVIQQTTPKITENINWSRLILKPAKWPVLTAKTQIILGTAKTLIRLGRCPGWSESSLGTMAILLVLSWGGSFHVSVLHIKHKVCILCSVVMVGSRSPRRKPQWPRHYPLTCQKLSWLAAAGNINLCYPDSEKLLYIQ